MKLDSKLFDRLRVKPDAARLMRDACPACEWQGCAEPGLYPAPKGRAREGEYHRFCLDHVREYNKSYNYFSGMPDEDVAKHQKEDVIGHRPTWFVGVNSCGAEARSRCIRAPERLLLAFRHARPVRLVRHAECNREQAERRASPADLRRAERKCLRQLSLEEGASKAEIKARFKDLVKRHHPDFNRGDRAPRTSCAK